MDRCTKRALARSALAKLDLRSSTDEGQTTSVQTSSLFTVNNVITAMNDKMSFESRIPSKAVHPELRTLLRVLEERDIPLGADDVAWAFEGSKTKDSAASWVQEFLQSSTLLTKDELTFYEKHGIDTQSSKPPAAAGRPLSDAEVEAAIDSLEASTVAIEKQTQILEAQKRALKDLQSRNSANDLAASSKDARQNKLARERAQIDFDIDELSQTAGGRIRTAMKQSDTANGAIPSQIDRLLVKDDRLLDGLRKLLPRISDTSLDRDETADVEQLCAALTMLSVKEIHARLDSVYRETVEDYAGRQNGSSERPLSDSQMTQRENARIELKELGSEIEGLVGIVVDHQHRKPLRKGLLSARADSQLQRAEWSEYTVTALLYLTSRLDAISDHVQHLRAHGNALSTISRVLDETISTRPPPEGQSTSSPVTDRSGAKGLKPLRLVQANRSEPQDPAVQFLRQYDIRVPENGSVAKLADALDSAIRERRQRLSTLASGTEQTITDHITQSIAKTDADLQVLLERVFAHSEHGTVRLVDDQVQTGLEKLECETQRIGDEMRELDIDAIARAVKAKQAEILRKLEE